MRRTARATGRIRKRVSPAGFTIIELLVVISIIGVLTAIIVANLSDARASARDKQRLAEIEQLSLALDVYKQAYGQYPAEGDDANGVVGEGSGVDSLLTPFMSKVPHDPLGPDNDDYSYYYDGDHDCGGSSDAVVFAQTMEKSANANWSDVCGGDDSEGGAGENSYMVVLGPSSD
jgi:general secretion pathway protein G